MNTMTTDLRPCPFCGHDAPTLVVMGNEKVERVSVVYTECGYAGPMTTEDDPSGHAKYLWNQRYGPN